MNIHASDFDPNRPQQQQQQQQQQHHAVYGTEDYYSTDEYGSAQPQSHGGGGEAYHPDAGMEYSSYQDNYSYDPHHHHHQQQQNLEDQEHDAYYNQNAEAFVPQQQQQHYEPSPYGEVDASTSMYGAPHGRLEMDPGGVGAVDPEPIPGTYYPTAAYPASDQGTPISALAWTELPNASSTSSSSAAAAATESVLQVAFHTQTTSFEKKSSRASYLSTHVVDAMEGSFLYLYSSVAAHPEASSNVMHRLFHATAHNPNGMMATTTTTTTTSRHNAKAVRIPSHAYKPPFSAPASTATTTSPHAFMDQPKCYMGIHTLLPFVGANGQHFTATASPSGVRIHTRGGLLVSSSNSSTRSGEEDMDANRQGLLCGTLNPTQGPASHITVGGVSRWGDDANRHVSNGAKGQPVVQCCDLYQNLRVVSSHSLSGVDACTALATNHDKQSLVAGCSDGTIRILDASRRISELAKVKGHAGGIANIAISQDGNLICTTGYAARSTSSHQHHTVNEFPDQHVLLFDVRYLGRGGMVHPFAGSRGGPRFVHFLPDDPNHRFAVASGQSGGGLQIVTPFEGGDTTQDAGTCFIQPPLQSGESMTDLSLSGAHMAIGTSQGNLFHYRMAGYEPTTHQTSFDNTGARSVTSSQGYLSSTAASSSGARSARGEFAPTAASTSHHPNEDTKEQDPLVMPPFVPPPPALSIDPTILQTDQPMSMEHPSFSIFNAYTLRSEPTVTALDTNHHDHNENPFGPWSNNILVSSSKRILSTQLSLEAKKVADDTFLAAVPTKDLGLDLLSKEKEPLLKSSSSRRFPNTTTRAPAVAHSKVAIVVGKPNPNKLLFGHVSAAICYNVNADPRKEPDKKTKHDGPEDHHTNKQAGGPHGSLIPARYRRTIRPIFSGASSLDYSKYNDTQIWPGWDYSPMLPNAYASSILLLLYFWPELRPSIMKAQCDPRLFSADGKKPKKTTSKTFESGPALSPELGFLFSQIDNLSAFGMCGGDSDGTNAQVGAFVPSNFLTAFAALPEASALALLDGAPAAVETARRPEAFYRFLMHHLDRELSTSPRPPGGEDIRDNVDGETKLLDSLQGVNFTSVNEFITGSGPPTVASTRAYTVDLAYDKFIHSKDGTSPEPSFGEVLHYTLFKEVRLRAWCQATRSYETVLQRKIATSLPKILSLSCGCAGTEAKDNGLQIWRKDDTNGGQWLPEMIEVELKENGDIIVKELLGDLGTDTEEWKVYEGKNILPESVSSALEDGELHPRKVRYQLDAVVSYIRDNEDTDTSQPTEGNGHHILHVRVPNSYKERALIRQIEEAERCAQNVRDPAAESNLNDAPLTLIANTRADTFLTRAALLKEKLNNMKSSNTGSNDSWILFNGFVVSQTISEDARAFHVPFKESCLVIFREIETDTDVTHQDRIHLAPDKDEVATIPYTVMQSRSLSTGSSPKYNVPSELELPGKGDLIAVDAEFVSVQHEQSALAATGSKETISEARLALARISVIDCRTGKVIIDDHVLPREPVVDYLTRFSGIVKSDLEPSTSPRHLITTRNAYLKLRLLLDRGCIFVGHGLNQDFFIVNLFVPPSQIIDTVEIFRQDRMRKISLRFLANHVLGRDMQQNTHDSIEDARAAFELYLKALEFKQNDTFEKVLNEIYQIGQRTDWKLGLDTAE